MKWGELMKCPKCGKENNAENARCFFCNNQLQAIVYTPPIQQQNINKQKNNDWNEKYGSIKPSKGFSTSMRVMAVLAWMFTIAYLVFGNSTVYSDIIICISAGFGTLLWGVADILVLLGNIEYNSKMNLQYQQAILNKLPTYNVQPHQQTNYGTSQLYGNNTSQLTNNNFPYQQ